MSPYDRERRLMPVLVEATRHGVRLDRDRLMEDTRVLEQAWAEADEELRKRIGVPDLDLDSGRKVHAALMDKGMLSEVVLTEKGNPSTSRATLEATMADRELLMWYLYRGALKTCVGTFCRSWLELSSRDGRLHPEWNQVRSFEDRSVGARTGRLSSSRPNFQNIPKPFDRQVPDGMPELPRMRQYVLPEEGHVWLKRDFSAQEIRIAAHFEDGALMEAFQEDANLDPHNMAKEIMHDRTGRNFDRGSVKATAFQIIYGGGAPALASSVGCSHADAVALREAYFQAMPGIQKLQRGTKRRGSLGRPIKTWGGRRYYVEPPKNGRSFEYKLLNYLIQGSAADQTKQAIIDWSANLQHGEVFMATVHDEINISAPVDAVEPAMQWLKESMNKPRFDVPMVSDARIGETWGDLRDYEE